MYMYRAWALAYDIIAESASEVCEETMIHSQAGEQLLADVGGSQALSRGPRTSSAVPGQPAATALQVTCTTDGCLCWAQSHAVA